MTTINLTADNFSEITERECIVLVDWWAEWCGPCKRFAPVFEAAATAHPDVTFGKVDTEAERELSETFAIQSIPTLMVWNDGILVFSQPGAMPAETLEDLVVQAKLLDMDDVRRQIAEQAEHAPT